MKPWRIIVFVLVMGTFAGGLLIGVNAFTGPRILKNEEYKLKSSVLDVLEIHYDKTNILSVFDQNVVTSKKDKFTFYKAPDGAVAFSFSGSGLWGPVSGIISLERDLKTIRKIKITHQEETPGLGGRIAESDYLKQFKTKEVFPKIVFTPEGKASRKNEVDAITGATGSSRALEKLLNESVSEYLKAFKG